MVFEDETTFLEGAAFFADDGLALALAVGPVTRLAGAGTLAAAFLGAADLATGFVLVFGTVLAAVLVADLGLILAAAEV